MSTTDDSQATADELVVRTDVTAGDRPEQHSEKLVVRTNVKAGLGEKNNHSERPVADRG